MPRHMHIALRHAVHASRCKASSPQERTPPSKLAWLSQDGLLAAGAGTGDGPQLHLHRVYGGAAGSRDAAVRALAGSAVHAEAGGRGWATHVPDVPRSATRTAAPRERAAPRCGGAALSRAGEAGNPNRCGGRGAGARAWADRRWIREAQAAERCADLRQEAARKEAAQAALETALSAREVKALRRSVEGGWRSEQDAGRLQTRAVRLWESVLARAGWSGREPRSTRRSCGRWG
jgi:hypothetical protein